MGYCISKEEPLGKAVERIFLEQLDKAIADLSDRAEPVTGLHSARKSVKRIRGLFRLLRPALPEEFFRSRNFQFRDINRLLSPLRDIHVQRETLEALQIPANTLALTYGEELAKEERTLLASHAVGKTALKSLSAIREEVSDWPLHAITAAHICCGWRTIYKKARRAYATAAKDGSPANFHEWRKRTKDLLYAFELLEEFGSKSTARLFSRAEDLNDCLGYDHDLFFIAENLRQQLSARPRQEMHRISLRLAKKRSRLEQKALKLGKIIFQAKPSDFEATIASRLGRLKSSTPLKAPAHPRATTPSRGGRLGRRTKLDLAPGTV